MGRVQAADPVVIKPANWAYDICFSPDGKYLAIVTGGQTVQFWDVERQRFAYDVNLPGLWGYTVDFSHDGELLAVGGAGADILIYRVRSTNVRPRLLKNLNANLAVMCLDFSSDGRWLAARGRDTKSIVFDRLNSRGITLETPKGRHTWAMRILFSPNGKLLAIDGDSVMIWKVGVWEKPSLQPGGVDGGVSFTPTSLTLEGGSWQGNGEVSQWRLKTGMTSRIKLAQIRATTYIEYSPGGNYLAAAGGQNLFQPGSIEIWKTNPKKLVKTLKGHTREIRALDFTSDGRFLASCSGDGTVLLWDISDIADPAPQSVEAADKLPTTWGNLKSKL